MEERIIEFVRENKFIYDKEHSKYRSKMFKDRKWMELSKELKIPVDTLKKKWKCMRDRYYRVRKSEVYATGNELWSPDKKKYKHYDSLLFLTEGEMTTVRSIGNFVDEVKWDTNECDTFDFGTRESLVEDVTCSAFNNSVILNEQKEASRSVDDDMINMLKSVKSSIDKKQTPFRAFLESIALTVENANLSITEVMSIQVSILNVVQNEMNKCTK